MLAAFAASARAVGGAFRDGRLDYHDAVDGLAVRAELLGLPYEQAAPIIARALAQPTAQSTIDACLWELRWSSPNYARVARLDPDAMALVAATLRGHWPDRDIVALIRKWQELRA